MPDFKILGVTLDYFNLFAPRMNVMPGKEPRPGQKARYDAVLLVPKDIDVKAVQAGAFDLLLKEKSLNGDAATIQALIQQGSINWPFNTKNLKTDGSVRFDADKYKMTITPWSYDRPGLADKYLGPDNKPLPLTAANADKLYRGCVVNVVVNPFWYKNPEGGRGIALGLRAVQYWAEGPRLGNKPAPIDIGVFDGAERPAGDVSDSVPLTGAAGGRGAALTDLFA